MRATNRDRWSVDSVIGAWIRLLKLHNLVLRSTRTNLADHCTMPQFDALAQLTRAKNGTTLAELSRHLLVTAGNVTGLIDRMERSGLVERKPDPQDRRATRVHLTSKGQQLARKAIRRHRKDIRQSFRALNATEIAQLRRLLDKAIRELEPMPEKMR